ncbi:MAG: hypothetical protein DMG23_00195 [Acidobacteria bacterium]|nr:MAG: hypothetical protein DMG23_00195 [Acidobacteriota bacterium]
MLNFSPLAPISAQSGRTDVEEIGNILPAVLRKRVRQGELTVVELLAPFWARVAGKPIAQRSRPAAFKAGTLTLICNCPSWAGQLRQMEEEIRAEINSFLGKPIIKKLRVQHSDSLEFPGLPEFRREAAFASARVKPD